MVTYFEMFANLIIYEFAMFKYTWVEFLISTDFPWHLNEVPTVYNLDNNLRNYKVNNNFFNQSLTHFFVMFAIYYNHNWYNYSHPRHLD